MQKWEYCSLTKHGEKTLWAIYTLSGATPKVLDEGTYSATLARLGLEGWEMSGVAVHNVSDTSRATLYFKRPIN